jgi:sigma-B regulation protein RsbU (phosphoserine phosphatase)
MVFPRSYRSIAGALIVSLLVISGATAHQTRTETSTERIPLDGKWKISLEDNESFSRHDYDDASWDTIDLPGTMIWNVRQKSGEITGTLWLRKKITVSENFGNGDLGLALGRIACADETYFNGHLIGKKGEFPPRDFSMWNHPRHYPVPKKIVRSGDNVIALRVFYFANAEVFGKPYLAGADDMSRDSVNNNFITITTGYIIIAMGMPFALIFLFFFIRRRKNQEYFFYFLQLFFGFFILLDLCTYWNLYGSTLTRLKILGFAWVGLNVAHPIFLHRIYGLVRKRTETLLWTYFSIVLFIGVVFTNKDTLYAHALLMISATTAVGLYNLSCHVSALYKKSPYAKLFSFFGVTVIIGAIHDGLVHLSRFTGLDLSFLGFAFQSMIFHYTAAVLFTGTSLVLVHQFINVMDTVEDLNLNLEKKVLDRTEELLTAKGQLEGAMEEMTTINESLTLANRELEKSEKRHELDMRLAGNVQSALFSQSPPQSKHFDIAFMNRPLTCVSGDFYDFYYSGANLSGIGLFDVSGHGISSGLITLLAKSIINRVYLSNEEKKLNRIMNLANRELINEINAADSYITGILIRFHDGHVEYVNSGHPELLFKSAKTGRAHKITDRDGNSISGPFLGVKLMDTPFKSVSFRMNPGDCLLLYTDCLVETKNERGEFFTEKMVMDRLESAPCDSAAAVLDAMTKSFITFIGDTRIVKDDLTVIVIKKIS